MAHLFPLRVAQSKLLCLVHLFPLRVVHSKPLCPVHFIPLQVVHLKPFWVVQLNRCHQNILAKKFYLGSKKKARGAWYAYIIRLNTGKRTEGAKVKNK